MCFPIQIRNGANTRAHNYVGPTTSSPEQVGLLSPREGTERWGGSQVFSVRINSNYTSCRIRRRENTGGGEEEGGEGEEIKQKTKEEAKRAQRVSLASLEGTVRAHAQTSASWLTAAAALAEEVELGVLVALEVRGGTREGVLHHDVDLPAVTQIEKG